MVNNELILSDIITQEDKKNRKMKILVKQREPKSIISNINNINAGQFLCENHYLINQYFCTECKK